jgi:histidinol-phosphatase
MWEQELAFASELADEADGLALEVFGRSFEVQRKADRSPVTEADLRIEALIRERLAERFPDDAVLGEEEGLDGSSSRVWVVDPIDGTKNFAAHIPVWGTLIALLSDGDPVLGVASAPAIGERYAAARGLGAALNGDPIRVSGHTELSESLVSCSSLKEWLEGPRAEGFSRLMRGAGRSRGFGDFWGHALVARGAADVMIEDALRTWDWAAVAAIVREAGGTVTQMDGSALADHGSVLTTNGALHETVLELFR